VRGSLQRELQDNSCALNDIFVHVHRNVFVALCSAPARTCLYLLKACCDTFLLLFERCFGLVQIHAVQQHTLSIYQWWYVI
jgi:hypothetical protein